MGVFENFLMRMLPTVKSHVKGLGSISVLGGLINGGRGLYPGGRGVGV